MSKTLVGISRAKLLKTLVGTSRAKLLNALVGSGLHFSQNHIVTF